MTKLITSFTILIATFTFFSCSTNSSDKKNEAPDEILDTISVSTDSLANSAVDEQEVSYNLPSALQIAYVFKKSGSAYISTLPNDKSLTNKYNTSNFKRASNFGVYSADLAYCLFNKKYQESKDYLKTLKEMGGFLNLNQAFESDNLAKRFDKNISNEDSVVKIVSSVQLKTDVMLEQNKQKHITVIAFTGAWIESAYIAAEVFTKDKNKKALASLCEQLLLAETIIKALSVNKNAEPEIEKLIVSVQKINTSFNSIAEIKKNIHSDEDQNFESIIITDIEFNALKLSITELRKYIVE